LAVKLFPGVYIVFGRRHHRVSDITFEGGSDDVFIIQIEILPNREHVLAGCAQAKNISGGSKLLPTLAQVLMQASS
jgi:hypothetical protein